MLFNLCIISLIYYFKKLIFLELDLKEDAVSILIPPTLQERFLRIKQIVKDAIAAHHTFMVYGRARVIRECLLKRGWCEKFYRKPNSGNIKLPSFFNHYFYFMNLYSLLFRCCKKISTKNSTMVFFLFLIILFHEFLFRCWKKILQKKAKYNFSFSNFFLLWIFIFIYFTEAKNFIKNPIVVKLKYSLLYFSNNYFQILNTYLTHFNS